MGCEKRFVVIQETCENGVEKEAELVEKVGWYIHLVGDNPNGIYMDPEWRLINAHTHNLENHVNHPDLQIVVPIHDESINGIFHIIVGKIKDGATFKDGDKVNGVLKSMPVAFFAAKDGDRDVLRVILPDPDGVVDGRKMKSPYNTQFDELPAAPAPDSSEQEKAKFREATGIVVPY